jgi:aryl-alcohol dehydrogenase-like predicted oxidoreductase
MRLDRAGDAAAVAALIDHAGGIGIDSLHCSSEYESFPLFSAAWARLGADKARRFRLIAKGAAPHFGEEHFSAATLRAKVEAYLAALSVERLDIVQWLLRFDLAQEERRLDILERSRDEIARVVADLKAEGKIAGFISFPYTAGLADAVIAEDYCDGLAVYLNLLERGMEPQIAEAAARGKMVFAIRPLAAGRIVEEKVAAPAEALDFVLANPGVTATIVSASSIAHLDAFRPWLAGAGR